MMNITPVVKQLLIINIIFFLGSMYVPVAQAYFPLYYIDNDMFRPWQFLTHMFMHGGFAHIFFNMFALYSFGSALEHFWGGTKFLFFYISCGLGAALLHTLVNYVQIYYLIHEVAQLNLSKTDLHLLLNMDYVALSDANGHMLPGKIKTILDGVHCTQEQFNAIQQAYAVSKPYVVGASGAIYGLLAAFAFMFPNAELGIMFIPIPVKAKYFVPGLLTLDLFLGFNGQSIFGAGSTGIAHFAHIGGALTGFIMMWMWKKNQFNDKRWN